MENQGVQFSNTILTLLAHVSPHALQSDLGPAGPRRIIGVDFELVPQCLHLLRQQENKISATAFVLFDQFNLDATWVNMLSLLLSDLINRTETQTTTEL